MKNPPGLVEDEAEHFSEVVAVGVKVAVRHLVFNRRVGGLPNVSAFTCAGGCNAKLGGVAHIVEALIECREIRASLEAGTRAP